VHETLDTISREILKSYLNKMSSGVSGVALRAYLPSPTETEFTLPLTSQNTNTNTTTRDEEKTPH